MKTTTTNAKTLKKLVLQKKTIGFLDNTYNIVAGIKTSGAPSCPYSTPGVPCVGI
jgi:hypothetical protein